MMIPVDSLRPPVLKGCKVATLGLLINRPCYLCYVMVVQSNDCLSTDYRKRFRGIVSRLEFAAHLDIGDS